MKGRRGWYKNGCKNGINGLVKRADTLLSFATWLQKERDDRRGSWNWREGDWKVDNWKE